MGKGKVNPMETEQTRQIEIKPVEAAKDFSISDAVSMPTLTMRRKAQRSE